MAPKKDCTVPQLEAAIPNQVLELFNDPLRLLLPILSCLHLLPHAGLLLRVESNNNILIWTDLSQS